VRYRIQCATQSPECRTKFRAQHRAKSATQSQGCNPESKVLQSAARLATRLQSAAGLSARLQSTARLPIILQLATALIRQNQEQEGAFVTASSRSRARWREASGTMMRLGMKGRIQQIERTNSVAKTARRSQRNIVQTSQETVLSTVSADIADSATQSAHSTANSAQHSQHRHRLTLRFVNIMIRPVPRKS
jgi:hypothetical protein